MSKGSRARGGHGVVSVIVPVYNESGNIQPMYDALREVAGSCRKLDWEFLFVDDGSTDNTFELLTAIVAVDPRLKVVQLSRNFGSHAACSAGLQLAAGDAAVIIAGDLQDHPREIPRLIEKWLEGFHVVWGVRTRREDKAADKLFSRLFAEIIRRIALPNYPRTGTGSFCLIDRLVIDSFNAFEERNRSIGGLILFSGFRQTQISYERLKRQIGTSKWSFGRKLKTAVDIIISFSVMPLRAASLSGLMIAVAAFIFMLYQIVSRVLYGTTAPGFTQSVVLLLMLGGLQLAMLGVLGEYLWRTLDDVRRRPLFFVQQACGEFSGYRAPLPPSRTPRLHAVHPQYGGSHLFPAAKAERAD